MGRRRANHARAKRSLVADLQRRGARVILRGPSGAPGLVALARVARTLPPGTAVVETQTGGEITLLDGRRAAWRCGRDGVNVFETIADRNRRQKLWRLPKRTKDAIHHACRVR